MKKQFLPYFFLFFVCSAALQAQNATETPSVLTYEQCTQYAREHNIQARQLQLQTESAGINLQQSKANRLPNANANWSHGLNYGRSIDPFTNSFNTEATQASQIAVSSRVVLYNGRQLHNTIEQRKLELEAANWDLKDLENNLQLNILSAYMQILLAEEQQRVLEQQAKVTQIQYEQTQRFVNAGALPAGNLLDIEAQIANDRLNMVNAANAVNSAYLALSQILNYYEPFKISKPTVNVPNVEALNQLTARQVFDAALATQPQLQSAALRTRIAEQSLKVAEGAQYPTVALSANLSSLYSSRAQDIVFGNSIDTSLTNYFTLTGTPIVSLTPEYSFKKTSYPTQLWNNLGGFIGLNVSIPIFNQFQVKNAIKLSRINITNAYLTQENTQNTLRQQVEQAYLSARAAATRYEALQANVTALQKSATHAEKRMNAGTISALEYLNIQNNFTAAQLNLESAKYEFYFRLKILDFYQGKSVNLK
ncbi:TolC family protein [Sphingobacteriales bacterium UPWRP_1]|nr:hypothetical protein B6N25_04950 [Sphingobacteriales bacterium TSM_CSS]PSJ78308.1 TolC family protein [Sphingobacteriales bacterium UPWRP_1]